MKTTDKPKKQIGLKPKPMEIPIEKLILYEYLKHKYEIPYGEWLKNYLYEIEQTEWFKTMEQDITENGMKTPLLVKEEKDGTYTVKDGRHRYCIALKKQLKTLPCITINDLKYPYFKCSELKSWQSRLIAKTK